MAVTDQLRGQDTASPLAAARALDARRFLTQSMILGYGYRHHGYRLLTEDDPFGRPADNDCDRHVAAMLSTEQQAFTAPEGVALRSSLSMCCVEWSGVLAPTAYATDPLQARWGPLRTSLVLGCVTAAFHIVPLMEA